MSEVLSSDAPLVAAPAPLLPAVAIGVAAVLIAGAGIVTVGFAGGGAQPEDVLPANVVAMTKVDLDPSLDQKKAVYQLSKKFKGLKTSSETSIKDDLLSVLFEDTDLDYAKDVKPWLGDRAAVGAVPDDSEDGFAPVAAVQYTDKDKADTSLKAAKADATDPFAYAFSGDYVIVATTQAEADRYAEADDHLADQDTFADGIDALGDDQLVTGWADVKGVYDALPDEVREQFKTTEKPSGSLVIGAHADSRYVEIQGKAVDVGDSLKEYGSDNFGSTKGHNLIATMPIDATAAMELTGLGDSLTKAFDELTKQPQFAEIQESAKEFGVALPGDLRTVLGTDLAVSVFGNIQAGDPAVAVHVLTDDPAGAVRILNRVAASEGGQAGFVVQTDGGGGYFAGTSSEAITRATSGTLGDSEPFKRALPDAKDAGFALFVSVGRASEFAGGEIPDDLSEVEAFGMTANGETGAFRMRLTFR
jgi:hypothetical protein